MKNLFKNGVPRYVRCYDNLGETYDRFTVVFTRRGRKDGYPYRAYSSNPTHPQGYAQWGEGTFESVDRPTYSHLGKKVRFVDLPAEVRRTALIDYLAVWSQPRLYVDLHWLTKERYPHTAPEYSDRTNGMWHQGDIVYNDNPNEGMFRVGVVLQSEKYGELRLDTNGNVDARYIRPATMAEIEEHDTLIPRGKIKVQ